MDKNLFWGVFTWVVIITGLVVNHFFGASGVVTEAWVVFFVAPVTWLCIEGKEAADKAEGKK